MTPEDLKLYFEHISRHFLALTRWVRAPNAAHEVMDVSSCFVLEVDDIWFLVTAGHVIKGIDEQLALGYKMTSWVLEDGAAGRRFDHGVPYHYTAREWMRVWEPEPASAEEDGQDYAATIIDPFTVRTLKAGGIVPITENVCRAPPFDDAVPWLLMGIPSESVKQGRRPTARLAMIHLMPSEPPRHIRSKSPVVFYGKYVDVPDGEAHVRKLEGMSGGPIFCTSESDEDLHYAAIGIQSGYFRGDRIVTFCPVAALSNGIRNAIEMFRAEQTARSTS